MKSVSHFGSNRYDLARGLSALVVFAAHASQAFLWPHFQPFSWIEVLAGITARAAVLVFFLLSGLLVTTSIVSNARRNGYFDPIDYLLSRVARIYPPFLFALVVTIAVVLILRVFALPGGDGALGSLRPGGLTFEWREVWRSVLLYDGMIGANGPLWTLYIEVKLYLIAMGVAMIFYGRSLSARIIGLIIALAAIKFGQALYGFWFFATIWTLGAFLNAQIARQKAPFAIVAFSLVVGSAVLSPTEPSSYLDGNPYGLGLQALGCVIFAYVYLLKDWAEPYTPRRLLFTSEFSYTLYVVHFPLLALGLSISLVAGAVTLPWAIVSALLTAAISLLVIILVAHPLEAHQSYKRAMVAILSKRFRWHLSRVDVRDDFRSL